VENKVNNHDEKDFFLKGLTIKRWAVEEVAVLKV